MSDDNDGADGQPYEIPETHPMHPSRQISPGTYSNRLDAVPPTRANLDAAIQRLIRTMATKYIYACRICWRHADLGTRTTHRRACPQHPEERAAGWGHVPCDCGLEPCPEHQ